MTGFYVHIPFCLRKCDYCNYVITTRRAPAFRSDFLKCLEKEIRHARTEYGKIAFDTLYLGGGTPSTLEAGETERVLDLIRNAFVLKEGGEITCEVNPTDVAEEKLKVYRKSGINRISLGVQSFNDRLLKDMGRTHTADDARRSLRELRAAGFRNISMDLIVRLPGQSPADWEETLAEACRLKPDQVVIYDLNVHPGTVYGSRARRGLLRLPSDTEHDAMWDAIERVLVQESGYVQYEISSFAKPGSESAHNLIYWHNEEYLGLGPGAFSYMKGERYVFAETVERYLKKITSSIWERDQTTRLTTEETEMEGLLTGLRLKEGVALSGFPHVREHLAREIPRLREAGLVENRNARLKLTPRGRRLPETVFTELSLAPTSTS